MMSRHCNRAFTLVEILTVVVILGIAAAVIVPQLGSRDDQKAIAGARMVMADLIYAQNRAISTQTRHYVVFNTSSPQGYRIVTSVSPQVDIPHPITKASNYVVTFGHGGTPGLEDISLGAVNFEGAYTTVMFDELGVPYYYDSGSNTSSALATIDGSKIEIKSGVFTMPVYVQPYTGEITTPSNPVHTGP
ncbi:MAG TPA: type II secretion system protein [Tepidisphaeraceae bacterium]